MHDFCLGYIFTDIDFDLGTAGFAHIQTFCRPKQVLKLLFIRRHLRINNVWCFFVKNSGFVTVVNHGAERSDETTALTFAHELGHSFGSGHDDDDGDPECKDQSVN